MELNTESLGQVDSLMKLLGDVGVLNSTIESKYGDLPHSEKSEMADNLENLLASPQSEQAVESLNLTSAVDNLEYFSDLLIAKESLKLTPQQNREQVKSAKPSIPSEPSLDEMNDAFERLQNILIGSELSEFRNLATLCEGKFANYEEQISEQTKLLDLIKEQIGLGKGGMVEALSPLIDEIIKMKIQQDRGAMDSAMAPVITAAISHKIRNSPGEIVKAIAPEIAATIKQQLALERNNIVDAYRSTIDEIIDNKTQENKISMGNAIAPALPVAITRQINTSPEEIARAIAPEMAAAIKEQIRLEQDAMADALYPIIGSTVTKYLGEAVQSINEKIENTLSPQGIKRKIRAKMHGISEAELLLKEVMPFKVRAIFLIHKGSGLVISEVQSGSERLESEMVAGMLTAIRSFVNDCIAQSGDVAEIDGIDYGNSKITLEVAGYCYIAAVVQGDPHQWFKPRLRGTMSSIVQNYGKQIELFDGDQATIPEQVNSLLEILIETSSKVRAANKSPTFAIATLAILSLIILLPWGFFQYRHNIERHLETEVANALVSTPELSVYRLYVNVSGETLELSGRLPNQYLSDRAQQIVQKTVPTLKLNNKIIAVEVPPDPVLTAAEVKRVTDALNQMDGVTISTQYADGKVTVKGFVSQIAKADKITITFAKIPGVKFVTNTTRLRSINNRNKTSI